MTDQMKISIIVPVYNVERYIEECLKSVMEQNFGGALECIVVDDCGSDSSMAVVERLTGAYTGPIEFRIISHDRNRGLSPRETVAYVLPQAIMSRFLTVMTVCSPVRLPQWQLWQKNFQVLILSRVTCGLRIRPVSWIFCVCRQCCFLNIAMTGRGARGVC